MSEQPYAHLVDISTRIEALQAQLSPLYAQRATEVRRVVGAGSPVVDVARASGLSRNAIYKMLNRE